MDKKIFAKTVLQRASVRFRLRNLQDRDEGFVGVVEDRDEKCLREFKQREIITLQNRRVDNMMTCVSIF